ncbi:hypothetical protein AOLI_G00327210 [Acnodon oligacanthus]
MSTATKRTAALLLRLGEVEGKAHLAVDVLPARYLAIHLLISLNSNCLHSYFSQSMSTATKRTAALLLRQRKNTAERLCRRSRARLSIREPPEWTVLVE